MEGEAARLAPVSTRWGRQCVWPRSERSGSSRAGQGRAPVYFRRQQLLCRGNNHCREHEARPQRHGIHCSQELSQPLAPTHSVDMTAETVGWVIHGKGKWNSMPPSTIPLEGACILDFDVTFCTTRPKFSFVITQVVLVCKDVCVIFKERLLTAQPLASWESVWSKERRHHSCQKSAFRSSLSSQMRMPGEVLPFRVRRFNYIWRKGLQLPLKYSITMGNLY